MPSKAARPCAYPGCPELVTKGSRCAAHTQPVVEVRDPIRHRLYGRSWREQRRKYLQSHPWCEDCLKVGIYNPATEVHHEERHKGDASVFNASPLMGLCKKHHSIRTAKEIHSSRGGEKVSSKGMLNVGVPPNEKNSQCEKFGEGEA